MYRTRNHDSLQKQVVLAIGSAKLAAVAAAAELGPLAWPLISLLTLACGAQQDGDQSAVGCRPVAAAVFVDSCTCWI